MWTTPKLVGHKLVAISATVAEQLGHKICNLWPHISKT